MPGLPGIRFTHMKILHFSDLHVKENKYFKIDDFIDLLSRIYNSAIKHEIKHIIFSGDFFDKKSNPRWIYDKLIDFFMSANLCEWHIGIGNHDLDKKGHGLEIFGIIKQHLQLKHINIIELPFVLEIDNYKIRIEHGIIKGALLDNECDIREDMVDINSNFLKGYDYVALGHLHISQRIKNKDIFGYYAGSPMHLNFGEAEHKKGWLIVDLKNKKVKPIKNNNYIPFVNVEVFYDYLTNEYEIKDTIPEKCHIKFRVFGNSKQISYFKTVEAKKIADGRNYIVEGNLSSYINFDEIKQKIKKKSIEDIVMDYFLEIQVDSDIDKMRLVSKAKKLIQEARDAS